MSSRWILSAVLIAALVTSVAADTLYLSSNPNRPINGLMVVAIQRQPGGVETSVLATPAALDALNRAGVPHRPFSANPELVLVPGVMRIEFTDLPATLTTGGMTPAEVALANFAEANIRSQVSRVRSDMRSMATAIEAYFIDYNVYPPWVMGSSPQSFSNTNPLLVEMPTFNRASITTPIAYITRLPPDAFNEHLESVNTFSFYTDGSGWILVSPGPDGDFDLDPRSVYTSAISQPSAELLTHSYDPTNGIVSGGDILRVRQ